MKILEGKKVLIVGVANKHSIAAGIAQSMYDAGAKIALTYQNERLKTNVEKLGLDWEVEAFIECDVSNDSDIDKAFKELWSTKILNFFSCLNKSHKWIDGFNKGTIHWGDARQKIYEIQDSLRFDLILLDPFSPQKCPELWSEQFISLLSERLSLDGRLITYSSAASVRKCFQKNGLAIYSIIPSMDDQNKWSAGTVAMKNKLEQKLISNNSQLKDLTARELEHLTTRSSIPYRDPTGRGDPKEIISTRETEQSKSQLLNTSSWKKKWNTAQKQ